MRIAILFLLAIAGAVQADELAPIRKWIAQQASIKSIESDFTQTRALRTLRSPVVTQGKFWFRAPSSFRWQTGNRPSIIALGTGKEIDLIRPAKKMAEHFPADRASQRARSFGLGMMNLPLAADLDDFQRQFEVLSIGTSGGQCHLELLPKDANSRRFLEKITVVFDVSSGKLVSFEIATREGSSMRTEFHDTRINTPLDATIFQYDLTGYKVTDAK